VTLIVHLAFEHARHLIDGYMLYQSHGIPEDKNEYDLSRIPSSGMWRRVDIM
jgi:hypothetical protein